MAAQTSRGGTAGTDHWSSEAYKASASFVPLLAQTVLGYIDPQPTDRVLDIGCGDGKFTGYYMKAVGQVLGLDASNAMVAAAKKDWARENVEYRELDCRYLDKEIREGSVEGAAWDKVACLDARNSVSNAALHWILRDPATRVSVLQAIHDCLKPNGSFVFEMGGHGNVPEVHCAMMAALVHSGVSLDAVRDANPWFFPSEAWMRKTLEDIGFRVEKLEMEYRPTKLTTDEKGGIEGWLRLMGASFFEVLREGEQRDSAVKHVCEVLDPVITREDGSKWLGLDHRVKDG
ncbi:hypothetical protein LOZ57_003888 [Ophidiomyces ophidiicola]|uniref:uncharacterized protein n=1 Tax=Ophidiomyces ophidiicola TaxID=1387563 RepID=UPI0020C39E3E|nr:uncharacterized protein LOZ57_003888 [Ophidiomyces ophidiicola]KAI1946136.1 hypothetical protein LOZ57_003888 [Ophidiomyces ophidiicola]